MAKSDDPHTPEGGAAKKPDHLHPPPPEKTPAKKDLTARPAKGKSLANREDEPKTAENVGNEALKQNALVAALAMAGADAWQKIVVYCLYGIIALVTVGLAIPPYEESKELILILAATACLTVAAGFILSNYQALSKKAEREPRPAEVRSPVVKLSGADVQAIREVMKAAQEIAFNFLKEKIPQLDDKQVRANIFLPECQDSGKAATCILKIREGLHFNMDYPPELNMTFKPSQGATGMVFSSKQARVAKRISADSAPGGWESIYKITEEQAKEIHRDLKWIISMPLKWDSGECMGVLNIDGLVYEPNIDDLYTLAAKLSRSALIIAGLMKE